MKPPAEPDVRPVYSLEARLFACDYASKGDVFRMKALGVRWDGKIRTHDIPIQKEASEQ